MVKVVIDGYNRRMTQMIKIVYTNTDAATPMRTQMLKHDCYNTNAETRLLEANTDAATQK